MTHSTSHKLGNALEGALAGGGDPATSPLYVFGPFLKLIVVAGVAQVTFGASVWMVVLTIMVVSTMYRLVMQWVTDGSGGSGLSEEEFGSWAVKVNAAITFVEYTLTFLVSMAALVTFIADRFPVLNQLFLGIQFRIYLAVVLSLLTGWLVNRGPKVAAWTFGPATAGVLILLWVMVISTILKMGLHLPVIDLKAFQPEYLFFTINGYARILAVMTGIEVFANLVAAYDGDPKQKSKKAFGSLMIIMGTAAITMLVVGPAIFRLSDPTNPQVSVFTQAMDQLLPPPLPYLGTMIGVAVLMSACAASSQGLQNLALGLKERNYIPPAIGARNKYGVAQWPVWIEIAIASGCFFFFGTKEETYLAIYAAGVFVLLSMTGWAVTKRLIRNIRQQYSFKQAGLIAGTILAATLTSGATVVIFWERFAEGAWTYFIFIPLLYIVFTYFRNQLGRPSPAMNYLGHLDMAMLAGFGFGQYPIDEGESASDINWDSTSATQIAWKPAPIENSTWRNEDRMIRRILVFLDDVASAKHTLQMACAMAKANKATVSLLYAVWDSEHPNLAQPISRNQVGFLEEVIHASEIECVFSELMFYTGPIGDAFVNKINSIDADLVITTSQMKAGYSQQEQDDLVQRMLQMIDKPVLIDQPDPLIQSEQPVLERILIALDGSILSERCLPYARALAKSFGSEVILISVPAVPEPHQYPVPGEVIQNLKTNANINMTRFLNAVARSLESEGLKTRTIVTGTIPADTIVSISTQVQADLILMTAHGRGMLDSFNLGSVANQVVQNTRKPIILVPIAEKAG